MIGRALLGAPWKIKEIMDESVGNRFEISNKMSLETAIKHFDFNSKFYGPKVGFKLLKSHITGYIKNIPNAAKIRNTIVTSETEKEMREKLIDLFGTL